ncbi:MAG: hypothetical protein AAGA68_27330 [Pseudomonadota bacterium]
MSDKKDPDFPYSGEENRRPLNYVAQSILGELNIDGLLGDPVPMEKVHAIHDVICKVLAGERGREHSLRAGAPNQQEES